jgi:hypothetical protein
MVQFEGWGIRLLMAIPIALMVFLTIRLWLKATRYQRGKMGMNNSQHAPATKADILALMEHVDERVDARYQAFDKRLDAIDSRLDQIQDTMITMGQLADFMGETFGEMLSEYRDRGKHPTGVG